jgi:hypothetical protein
MAGSGTGILPVIDRPRAIGLGPILVEMTKAIPTHVVGARPPRPISGGCSSAGSVESLPVLDTGERVRTVWPLMPRARPPDPCATTPHGRESAFGHGQDAHATPSLRSRRRSPGSLAAPVRNKGAGPAGARPALNNADDRYCLRVPAAETGIPRARVLPHPVHPAIRPHNPGDAAGTPRRVHRAARDRQRAEVGAALPVHR